MSFDTRQRKASCEKITVHMIGHAHLDPVWLWPWQAGLDEALNTCRSACNLLDRYPQAVFTNSSAWWYRQIERVDRQLFGRVRQHVEAGRWEITGGWWVQPDCNFPSEAGFQRQIQLGRRFFEDRFGRWPEVAYNVDSFGHAASLPRIMRANDQRFYVMMRPGTHEMELPARLFRWRGHADDPEVIVFRIAGGYNSPAREVAEERIREATTELPDGVLHTMCFYGVGDHGGGPTAELIEWIEDHRTAFEGCELVLSSPTRFFSEIEAQQKSLPVVTGELQHHAIGCYSVRREVKTRVRQAEHRLVCAERMADDGAENRLQRAWERVCFAHFHDTVGGTSISSAYRQVNDQLGEALAAADEVLQYGLRRDMQSLPDDPRQRLVLFNSSDLPYEGWVEVEPWTEGEPWHDDWCVLDENNNPLPFQVLRTERTQPGARLLFRTGLETNAMQVVKIDRSGESEAQKLPPMSVTERSVANAGEAAIHLSEEGRLECAGLAIPLPHLVRIPDPTDNWSHGVDRYPEGPVTSPEWNTPCVLHEGALMSALVRSGRIGKSELGQEWRIYAEEPFVEMHLRMNWVEKLHLLKLVIPTPAPTRSRVDGIPGGNLGRKNDGRELPVQDWTCCEAENGDRLGVVCPNTYALDGLPHRLRITLLRSPVATHHDPRHVQRPDPIYTDQGTHTFRFRFYLGGSAVPGRLRADAHALHRPPVTAELTRGMGSLNEG